MNRQYFQISLLLLLLLLFSGCLKKQGECVSLIHTIDELKNKSHQNDYEILKGREDAEYLIFQYHLYRDFQNKLDRYLRNFKSTLDEDIRYTGNCKILTDVTNENKNIKIASFENKMKVEFTKATKIFFDKHHKVEIDLPECISYLNLASRRIGKHQDSRKYRERKLVEEAISKFELCKYPPVYNKKVDTNIDDD